jgi:hypothetical protein
MFSMGFSQCHFSLEATSRNSEALILARGDVKTGCKNYFTAKTGRFHPMTDGQEKPAFSVKRQLPASGFAYLRTQSRTDNRKPDGAKPDIITGHFRSPVRFYGVFRRIPDGFKPGSLEPDSGLLPNSCPVLHPACRFRVSILVARAGLNYLCGARFHRLNSKRSGHASKMPTNLKCLPA